MGTGLTPTAAAIVLALAARVAAVVVRCPYFTGEGGSCAIGLPPAIGHLPTVALLPTSLLPPDLETKGGEEADFLLLAPPDAGLLPHLLPVVGSGVDGQRSGWWAHAAS